MVMPFVRKSLNGLSVDLCITEEEATPMVSTPFPREDLEGYNHTVSFKVELGVLNPSCHQTNITQNGNCNCWNIFTYFILASV